MSSIPRVSASRYVQPLREGGSLPAVVEADDGELWVVKFRGAGQGPRALIAELIVGLIALELELPVPALALVDIAEAFGRSEPDPEIRDVLRASHGVNVALRYLDGAFNYEDAAAGELVDPELAAAVVWLDAYLTNPDRTAKNPNLLVWGRRPWLIDHGSALYVQHAWKTADEARTRGPFPLIRDHVLLHRANDIAAADARLAPALGDGRLAAVLDQVPDELLEDPLALGDDFADAAEARRRYVAYLRQRLEGPRAFVAEAERARTAQRDAPPRRLGVRR